MHSVLVITATFALNNLPVNCVELVMRWDIVFVSMIAHQQGPELNS